MIGVAAAARAGIVGMPRPFALGWLAMFATAVTAAALGADPLLSALGDSQRLGGLVTVPVVVGAFALGTSLGRDGVARVRLAGVIGLVAVLVIAFLQLAGLVSRNADRIDATLGNAGFLGAYLCLVLPLALSMLAGRTAKVRLAFGVVVGAAVIVTVATGTRGAWIGAAVAIASFAALEMWRRGGGRRWAPTAAVLAAFGLVLIVAITVPVGRRGAGQLDLSSGTGRGRLDTWANTAPVLTDRPVTGWGPENFRTAFEATVSKDWVRRYGLEQLPDRAHNRFLDVTAASGALGLAADLALLGLVAAACRRALRATREDPQRWYAVAGITAGLIGWLVQGQFLFDTFDLSILWWLLAGSVVAVVPTSVETALPRAVWLLPATLVVVVAIAGSGLVADRRAADALADPDPQRAIAGLASAVNLRPRQLDLYLLAGTVAIQSKDATALSQAHDLLDDWDDPDVQLSDAEVLARLGKGTRSATTLAQAASAYREVLRHQPNNGLAWLGLGETLVAVGDKPGGKAALESALDLLPRSPFPALDLGLLALVDGDTAAACRHARTAARISPSSREVADLRSRVGATGACG